MSSTDTRPTPSAVADRVAVAAGDGLHLGGATAPSLAGTAITAIAPEEGVLWALADRRDLLRIDGGTAEPVATLAGRVGVCVHAHQGRVFVGGDDAGLWVLGDGALEPVEAFAQAPTSADWHTPWGGPPSVFSMASLGDDLFVSVHVGGILRSSDGGQSWEATIDLHEDVHQVAADPAAGTLWAATGTSGLAGSADRGRTWDHHTDGLHATYLLAVAVTDAGILVGASSGHAGRDGAVQLFDGSRFHRPDGLPAQLGGAVGPRHLVGDGGAAAVLLPDGSLFVSDDGGRHWDHGGGPFDSPAEVRVR